MSSHRPLLQLPHPAVADGLVSHLSPHMPPETHCKHGDQGGQACELQRADPPARSTQLGLCTIQFSSRWKM